MASARSSCKDLLERISSGSQQDLLLRTCTRSCKDLLERISTGSPEDLLIIKYLCKITRGPLRGCQQTCYRPDGAPWSRRPFCASLRSRNGHGLRTRDCLRENLQWKCHKPWPRGSSCASLRSRNAHGHLTRALLRENLQWKNAEQMEHPDLTPAL